MQTLNYPEAGGAVEPLGAPDFSQIVQVIRERAWVVLVCALAGLLAAGVYLKRLPVRFESKCVLQLEPRGRVLGFEAESSQGASGEGGMQTFMEAFRSRALLERTVQELRLQQDRDFSPNPLSADAAIGLLGACIEVRQRKGTQLIDILARHGNALVSQKLADGVAKAFIQSQLDQRSSGARSVLEFLVAEAERLKLRLQKSEEALQGYKESNQSASLED
ncbi:MAG: Wzz/FepE/Etk N-terminal domain-containing protein, partial [Verrucomicrobiota bacterium]